jgi:hypothetical protein
MVFNTICCLVKKFKRNVLTLTASKSQINFKIPFFALFTDTQTGEGIYDDFEILELLNTVVNTRVTYVKGLKF